MSLHQRKVWWFINTLLPVASDADDVLQETSLILWQKWEEFDRDRDFLSWAFGIARRQVLKYVREHRSRRQYLDESLLGEIAAVAEKRIRSSDREETRLQALKKCMESLAAEERAIVESRYHASLSPKQIAEAAGRPLASIYTVLRRARIQLSECVNRRLSMEQSS